MRGTGPEAKKIQDIFRTLETAMGPQHWWPAGSAFEVVVGAYLTQNTAWTNVERAIGNLRAARALSVSGVRNTPLEEFEQLVRPAGYFRQKAVRLKRFVANLDETHGGSLDAMLAQPLEALRQELLGLPGIGPETADSILLYAASREVFVVDAYARRIFERHALIGTDADYDQIRLGVERALACYPQHTSLSVAKPREERAPETPAACPPTIHPPAAHPPSAASMMERSELSRRYNEFHALIVQTAKHYCVKGAPAVRELPASLSLAARVTVAMIAIFRVVLKWENIDDPRSFRLPSTGIRCLLRIEMISGSVENDRRSAMPANRVLFVDDEWSLRLTLPQILRMHGFDVRVAATVAEALAEITTRQFDVLISDLNIGEAGDGFTVVSAMRRTQPDCINIIVTGFPAFESALAAIQRQVDDYLIKPASIENLVGMIQEKISTRSPHHFAPPMRLSKLLRETVDETRVNTLARMKANPALRSFQMSDDERVGSLGRMVAEIADQLDSSNPDEPANFATAASREHGLQRLSAGYTISMLVTDSAILDAVVFDIVRERLLLLDTSSLMLDLKRFNLRLQLHLEQSIQAFFEAASPSSHLDRKIGPSASPLISGDSAKAG